MHSLPEITQLNGFVARGMKAQSAVNATKVKPTTESIKAAHEAANRLAESALSAAKHLHTARLLFEYDVSAPRVVEQLERAKEFLVTLRRTQTAALENIEDAIKSAAGGKR